MVRGELTKSRFQNRDPVSALVPVEGRERERIGGQTGGEDERIGKRPARKLAGAHDHPEQEIGPHPEHPDVRATSYSPARQVAEMIARVLTSSP